MPDTIVDLKRKLYHALLCKEDVLLSENEIELGYLLSKDSDIQDILRRVLK